MIVLAALALVAVIGLFATIKSGDMLMMPTLLPGGAAVYATLLFLMWWTMMLL